MECGGFEEVERKVGFKICAVQRGRKILPGVRCVAGRRGCTAGIGAGGRGVIFCTLEMILCE